MLSPTPSPETVFQSEPDYLGVTGLWALPARPADATDALLVLSSVSGSRALSTGAPWPTVPAHTSFEAMLLSAHQA